MTQPAPPRRYLSTRFSTALMLAAELHATQKRKNDDRDIPYISHLLAVAALVLEDGGSEDEAIAGLLHDALEDQGLTRDRVDAEFESEVARIVRACSDAQAEPGAKKPAWLPRKLAHLAHLEHADTPILRVTAADKLHNCLDVVADVERDGSDTLMRFNGKIDGTCCYYGAMAQLVSRRLPGSGLWMKLELSTRRLHELVAIAYPAPLPVSLGSDEEGPLPGIDEIWRRIVSHAGELFRQVGAATSPTK
jgi:hypothetical protein